MLCIDILKSKKQRDNQVVTDVPLMGRHSFITCVVREQLEQVEVYYCYRKGLPSAFFQDL